jgi:hypothetical protein
VETGEDVDLSLKNLERTDKALLYIVDVAGVDG